MGAQIRVYRSKINSTQSMKKIFKAMEMIATSRINSSRQKLAAARPYANAMTRALSQVLSSAGASVDSPYLNREHDQPHRTAIVVFASDRGLAGAYSSNVLKKAQQLAERHRADGTQTKVYLVGRKAKQYLDFRSREYERVWEGDTDSAKAERAEEITELLLEDYRTPFEQGGVDQIELVYTRFESMVTQEAKVMRLLPLELTDANALQDDIARDLPELASVTAGFEFEPSPEKFLERAVPRYLRARIYSCLCHAAASELASRQRAMKAAGDNAQDLIGKYTRLMNNARQAEVTTELTEIVSASEAL